MSRTATAPCVFALAAALSALPISAPAKDALPTFHGAVDATSSGPTIAERFALIQRRVREAIAYPPIARVRGVRGESQIEFAIDREGSPFDIVTLESSGSALLDRAAVRAVEKAAPLPWIHGRIIVPVRFELGDDGEG